MECICDDIMLWRNKCHILFIEKMIGVVDGNRLLKHPTPSFRGTWQETPESRSIYPEKEVDVVSLVVPRPMNDVLGGLLAHIRCVGTTSNQQS